METKLPDQQRTGISRGSPSFEALAAQQGVQPVRDLSELLGAPHPGDESAEEFSKLLRGWRSEGARAATPQ